MWEIYHTVSSLDDAVALLAQHKEKARIIAGGTDLLIELERGQRAGVSALIDITRVPGLTSITEQDGRITLGPLTTHNHIVASDLIVKKALPLAQASWEVGAPQIRNRATVAGNVITASPANDTISPLMALNASITLKSASSERIVPMNEFYTGLRKTVMQPDEMLTAISFEPMKSNQRGIFLKLGLRQAQAISVINTSIILELDGDTITQATITLGSVAPTIVHAPSAEAMLVGKQLTDETIRQAAYLAADDCTPITDVRGSAEYRKEMIRVMVARGLRRIAKDEQAQNWPVEPSMLWGKHPQQSSIETHTHDNHAIINTTINGQKYEIASGQDKTLLRFLREDAGLIGTKEGCAEGECGACTVFLDGEAVMACMVPAPRAHQAEILTVEGLAQDGNLHPVQESFIECGAVQCGYCTPGFLMATAKLLEEHPTPSQQQITTSISGNLCRCTGYYKIIEAVQLASRKLNERG